MGRWLAVVVMAMSGMAQAQAPADDRALSGGASTVFVRDSEAYSQPLPGLDRETTAALNMGRRLFRHVWPVAPTSRRGPDGLGPLFNRNACSGCHVKDGRGRPPARPGGPMKSMLIRLGVPGAGPHGGPKPHPVYGGQLQDKAIPGVAREGLARITYEPRQVRLEDGTMVALRRPRIDITDPGYGPLGAVLISSRLAPAVFGLGLIEAVDDATLIALADPDDADGDGISGKVNWVWDAVDRRLAVGRFGWKARRPSLRQQIAAALRDDMGVTSPVFPDAPCSDAQTDCLAAPGGSLPELSGEALDRLVLYLRALAVPARRDLDDPAARRGARIFDDIGCAACHQSPLVTGRRVGLAPLAGQLIRPYSDFLLHDMGPGLADGLREFDATGGEWRTAPLWGIGLAEQVAGHAFFLHDGRARDLTEAILWHGGEAKAAARAFRGLSRADRDALVAFLRSL